MISNPPFLFGFYSRRMITGRKPYKRLRGNDGKDVTFHIKKTLIPSLTSNTPSSPTHPTAAISLPTLWGSGTPPTSRQQSPPAARSDGTGRGGKVLAAPAPRPRRPVPPRQGEQAAPGWTEEAAPRLKMGCWCSRTLLHGVQTCSERFLGSDM